MENPEEFPSPVGEEKAKSRFQKLCEIPFVGVLVSIFNAYAYRGDAAAISQCAPLSLWIKALRWQFAIASVAVFVIFFDSYWALFHGQTFLIEGLAKSQPSSVVISIIPNLLGFGIGVYALVFALSPKLVRNVDEAYRTLLKTGKRRHGSVLVLNADLAFPLIVLAGTIFVGVAQLLLPGSVFFNQLCWFSFFFSMVCVVEMVGTLFELGDQLIMEKIGKVD